MFFNGLHHFIIIYHVFKYHFKNLKYNDVFLPLILKAPIYFDTVFH